MYFYTDLRHLRFSSALSTAVFGSASVANCAGIVGERGDYDLKTKLLVGSSRFFFFFFFGRKVLKGKFCITVLSLPCRCRHPWMLCSRQWERHWEARVLLLQLANPCRRRRSGVGHRKQQANKRRVFHQQLSLKALSSRSRTEALSLLEIYGLLRCWDSGT